jgi:uncharacterized protein YjbI with pentapeptide repeats
MLVNEVPMEQLQFASFKEALFQSRNAEEALLSALNACARLTGRISGITHPSPTAFGAWFRRIQGQRTGPEPAVVADCLSLLNLGGAILDIADFYAADLSGSDLSQASAHFVCFGRANLAHASLEGGLFFESDFRGASLQAANMRKIQAAGARFDSRNFEPSDLSMADLSDANLEGARLDRAQFRGANLRGANLSGANLTRAGLEQAALDGANLARTKLTTAEIAEASFEGASFKEAQVDSHQLDHLRGADLSDANIRRVSKARKRVQPRPEQT